MNLETVRECSPAVLQRRSGRRVRLGPLWMMALVATTPVTTQARSLDPLPGSVRVAVAPSAPISDAPIAACADALVSITQVQALVDAQASARDALITIRRNAQDWKNLLLRGSNVADRQTMLERFETQARLYEAELLQLRSQLAPFQTELNRMDVLERERVKLFEQYRAALATHGVETLAAAALADRAVQGADVATFRTLEKTIDALTAMTRVQFQTLTQRVARCVDGQSRPL